MEIRGSVFHWVLGSPTTYRESTGPDTGFWSHAVSPPPPQLVAAKEESNEMGGYFICNGIERIIRCLIQQRRHYVMALRRGAYQKRGANYTPIGTLVRCGTWPGHGTP